MCVIYTKGWWQIKSLIDPLALFIVNLINPHPPTWGLFGPQTTYCSIYFPQCNKSISELLDMRCRELA